MADVTALENRIRSLIKTNGNQEITGAVAQQVLLDIVDSLNTYFEAEASARQNADNTLQSNINSEASTRQNADSVLQNSVNTLQTAINSINTRLAEGYVYVGIATAATNPDTPTGRVFYIATAAGTYTNFSNLTVTQGINILKYNGSAWSVERIVSIDDEPIAGSNNLVKSGGVYITTKKTNDLYSFLLGGDVTFNATGTIQPLSRSILEGETITAINGNNIALYTADNNTPYIILNSTTLPYKVSEGVTLTRASSEITNAITTLGVIVNVLTEREIVDNLTTDNIKKVLSARQGKIIKQLIDNIVGFESTYSVTGTIRSLSKPIAEGCVITDIHQGGVQLYTADSDTPYVTLGVASVPYTVPQGITFTRALSGNSTGAISVEGKLYGMLKVSDIINNLTSTSTNKPLAANQGKILKGLIDTINMTLKELIGKTITYLPTGTPQTLSEPLVSGDTIIDFQDSTTIGLYVDGSNTPVVLAKRDLPYTVPNGTTYTKASSYATKGEIITEGKLSILDNIDNEPKENSKHLIYSGAVYAAIQSIMHENVDIAVPDTIYATVGDTLQLYFFSIFGVMDFKNYDVSVVCNIGAQYPRYYELTPVAGNIGTHTITFRVRDNNGVILGEKECSLVVSAGESQPSSSLNVLCVGSSLTANGQWVAELKRRLCGTGGTPVGKNFGNINFVGRMSRTVGDIQTKLEATGGYSLSTYVTATSVLYHFNFTSEVPAGEVEIGNTYEDANGHILTVTEINLTEGVGNISCSSTSNHQQSGSGVLTKVTGEGADTLTYSSSSVNGNPFVYNSSVNIQAYANEHCNGSIDIVSISELALSELVNKAGTREYLKENDLDFVITKLDSFISMFTTAFPNVKFMIALPALPDPNGGLAANYTASDSMSVYNGLRISWYSLIKRIKRYITDNSLDSTVFVMNWIGETDSVNDYLTTQKPVNVRKTSVTEVIGTNGLHPSNYGYHQFADSAFRCFIHAFCN